MATLLSDDFNRVNNNAVIGSPQIGPDPVVRTGTGGIISSQLYAPVPALIATWDLGTVDVELSAVANSLTGSDGIQLIIGWTAAEHWRASFLTNGVSLMNALTAGTHTVVTSTKKNPAANGSICKVHYRDRVFRVYVDDVLVIRWEADVPLTSTEHGVRLFTTPARMDNFLGTDAPFISDDGTGAIPTSAQTLFPTAEDIVGPSAAYLGRDTFLQDQAAGA